MITPSIDPITLLALGGPAGGIGTSTVTVPASPPISQEQAEREVLELEHARNEAIRTGDRESLSRIYADDFVGVTTAGSIVDKESVLRVLSSVDQRLSSTVEDLRLRFFCDTALVTGRMVVRPNEGREAFSTIWYTHVYVQQKGRWVLVAGQSSNVSP
jgi:hypothetical protein